MDFIIGKITIHCLDCNLYLYLCSAFIYNKSLQIVYAGVSMKHFIIVVTVTFITREKFHSSPTFSFVFQY